MSRIDLNAVRVDVKTRCEKREIYERLFLRASRFWQTFRKEKIQIKPLPCLKCVRFERAERAVLFQ